MLTVIVGEKQKHRLQRKDGDTVAGTGKVGIEEASPVKNRTRFLRILEPKNSHYLYITLPLYNYSDRKQDNESN